VHDDLEELPPSGDPTAEPTADPFVDAIVLDRVRDAMVILDELDAPYVLRAWAKLAAREADRQDAAGRPGAARLAEDEALEAADAAAAAEESNGGEVES
jgi:hypothetical protein